MFQGLRNRLKSVVTLICLPAEIPLTVNLIKANHQVLPPVSCHHLGLVVSSMGVSENEGYTPNWLFGYTWIGNMMMIRHGVLSGSLKLSDDKPSDNLPIPGR